MTITSLRLRDVTNSDLLRIGRWFLADHVRAAWGDPAENFSRMQQPPREGERRAVIEADGRDVGLVAWGHPIRAELDAAGLSDIPTTAIDVDIMIGEVDAVGRGVGTAAIAGVVRAAMADPTVPFVMACIQSGNPASQRAFTKAGFRKDREFFDVSGDRYALFVRARSDP